MSHTTTQHLPNEKLDLVQNSELNGLKNLITKEMNAWFNTRLWWTQILIWSVILPAFISLAVLTALDGLSADMTIPFQATIAQLTSNIRAQKIIALELNLYFNFVVLLLPIGIPILLMNSLLGEQEDGSIEWVLSNPVQRKTIILSKLIWQTLATNFFLVLVPSAVVYSITTILSSVTIPLGFYCPAVGLLVLLSTFYITLSYLIQVLSKSRAIVLGIPIAFSIFGGDIPVLQTIAPAVFGNFAFMIAINQAIPAAVPLVIIVGVTFILTIGFAVTTIFIFNKEEF